jgi:hypothetical protein
MGGYAPESSTTLLREEYSVEHDVSKRLACTASPSLYAVVNKITTRGPTGALAQVPSDPAQRIISDAFSQY